MSWEQLLEAAEAVRAGVVGRDASLARLPLLGIGWATVEHERAERELEAAIGPADVGEPATWAPAARDDQLGAGAWRRTSTEDGRPALVVLEPDTEGRLAAFLARFGEGVAVVYLGDGPVGDGPVGPGPVGPGRLVRGGPVWGPHAIVVAAEAGGEP